MGVRKNIHRNQILAAAKILFQQKRFQDISIDQLAAAAGLTKPALYYHFKSKYGLYEEAMKYESTRTNA
jgi:TetR/AcrR family transcriptional regulator, cholesterol catabolism regulator